MGSSKVNLFHEHVLVKEPGTLGARRPGTTTSPTTVDGEQIVSLWIPLDPVPARACLEFVAGSHRWGKWFMPARFKDGAQWEAQDPRFVPMPDIEAERARHAIVAFDLEPGDCIAFHGLTVHGAPGESARRAPPRVLGALDRRRRDVRPAAWVHVAAAAGKRRAARRRCAGFAGISGGLARGRRRVYEIAP